MQPQTKHVLTRLWCLATVRVGAPIVAVRDAGKVYDDDAALPASLEEANGAVWVRVERMMTDTEEMIMRIGCEVCGIV